MNINDIDKAYVSPIDKFLFQFDADHDKSKSQLAEIEKHARVATLRDVAQKVDATGEIWKDF